MNTKTCFAATFASLLAACTPGPATPDGAVLIDEEVALERQAVDVAHRVIEVDANSVLVAIVDENLTDVRIKLEAVNSSKDSKPVEVENHLEGVGVEVAAIDAPKGSRIKLTIWGPPDKTAPGRVHLRVRRYDESSKFPAQVGGFEAWSIANNAANDGGAINRSGLKDMTRAIELLDSPGGDAALVADARLIRTNMLLTLTEVELFEARVESQRTAKAFAALPKANALGVARARFLDARALSKISQAPSWAKPDPPQDVAEKMARDILTELSGPTSPFGPIERARMVAKLGYMDSNHSAEQAQVNFEAARLLFKEGGHVAGEVEMRANLAECLTAQGRRFESAQAYDAVLPDLHRISNNDVRVAYLLFAARAQSFAGRTDEATEHLLQALAQARQYKLRGQEGGALQALGNTYWNRGDYYQARSYFDEALRLARLNEDDIGVGFTLQNAGMVARHDGDYAAAIEMHEESVKLIPEPIARMRSAHQLALDYVAAGDYPEAVAQFRRTLEMKLPNPRHYAYCDVKRDLAQTLIAHGGSPAQLREASTLLAGVLKQAAEVHDALGQIGARAVTASLLAKQDKPDAARREYERVFALIFDYRRSTSNPQLLTTTLGFEQPAFRGYFDLMMRDVVAKGAAPRRASKNEEDALRMLEVARESHFGAVRAVPMDAEAGARVDAALAQMATKSLEIARMLKGELSAQDSKRLAALQFDMSNLRAQVDRERTAAAQKLAAGPKGAASAVRDWRPVAPDAVQLSYALGNEHAYVWMRSAGGTYVATLSESPEKIERALAELASLDAQRAPEKIEQALAHVSSVLLPRGLLPEDSTALEIVAEGRIANVPFAGLSSPTDPARRLVETHAVTLITSMLTVDAAPRPSVARPFRLVGLASGMGTLRSAPVADLAPALQAATAEIRAVAALFAARDQAAKVKLLTGSEGSAAELRGIWSSGADVVHFATHALADLRQPLASLLVLPAKGADGTPTYLTAGQVQAWRGDADLVFLSACESALGPPRFAGGMPGLQSAFLRAGARGVIATLWPIEDVLAREFSADFYQRFTSGKTAAQSLSETQRAWLAPKAGASEDEQLRRRITALAHGFYTQ